MTPSEEITRLQALGVELASSAESDLQPRCIARAFARSEQSIFALTMQGWIDLDTVNSPILHGLVPDGEDAADQIKAALAAFKSEPDGLIQAFDPTLIEPEEAAAIVRRMLAAVRQAFSMCLKMRAPRAPLDSGEVDGFGAWLPMLAFLVVQCGLSMTDALATRVDQAFALAAGMRRNQGWIEAGQPYAQREVE